MASKFDSLASNPLFGAGLQILANSGRSTMPRSPFAGVGGAMQNAQVMGMQQKLFERQEEEYRRRQAEREAAQSTVQNIAGKLSQAPKDAANYVENYAANLIGMEDEPADLQAGGPPIIPNRPSPYGHAQVQQDLLKSGNPQMAQSALGQIMAPPTMHSVAPGATLFASKPGGGLSEVAQGGPPLSHLPLPPDKLREKMRIANAGRSQTNLYSGPGGELRALQSAAQDGFLSEPEARSMREDILRKSQNEARTPGQVALDKEVGTGYHEWRTTGGADAVKQLSQVREVLQTLQSGAQVSGPMIGMLPRFAQTLFHPGAVNTQEQVADVVQRSMRPILGAQFTEKEGERMIARAYNMSLSPETNRRRIARLYQMMLNIGEAKQSMYSHFGMKGTLDDYESAQQFGMSEMTDMFDSMIDQMDIEDGLVTPLTGDVDAQWDKLPAGALYTIEGSNKVMKK